MKLNAYCVTSASSESLISSHPYRQYLWSKPEIKTFYETILFFSEIIIH